MEDVPFLPVCLKNALDTFGHLHHLGPMFAFGKQDQVRMTGNHLVQVLRDRGLALRDALPPGLERQLERNGTLPPGLAKRALPSDLESKLPPPAPGTERVIVERDVVLVDLATGIVRDILRDVLD